MNEIQVNEAYAEWIDEQHYDLFITLNTERELTDTISKEGVVLVTAKEKMSSKVAELFGRAETYAFGKTANGVSRRRLYRSNPNFHIHRFVSIEGIGKRTHTHLLVKTLEGWTDGQMIELLDLVWCEMNKAQTHKAFLFRAETIRSKQAVSRYITKETHWHNKQLEDSVCLRSSFVSKP